MTRTKDSRWFMAAACQGLDPAIFYPEDETQWPEAQFVQGLCASCPVRTECLDYSITSPYKEEGFWSGVGPTARDKLRRSFRKTIWDFRDGVNEVAVTLAAKDEVLV